MTTMQWIEFPDVRFPVFGLPWFAENSPSVQRFPARLKPLLRSEVWDLSLMPAGGRIRFAADTTSLSLRVSYDDVTPGNNFSRIGQMGFDVYIDGQFYKPVWPEKTGQSELTFFSELPRTRREYTLYMPNYKAVTIRAVAVDSDALLAPPAPYANDRPVVFYGTSITQGGCCSHSGMSYQGILSRLLNIDYVNLGFSGEGRGEPECAAAVAEIDASCFVLDFAQNCPTVDELVERYGPFIDTIRAAHPDTPIVCITPIFATRLLFEDAARTRHDGLSQVIRKETARRIAAGDTRLVTVEGLTLLSPADSDCLVDGIHPNDLGFYREAHRLAPVIESALRL